MGRLLRSAGLPAPRVELVWGPGGRYRLDFAYPELRLVAEVGGWAYHSSPEQARYDAVRRNALNQAGWTVLEFDWWVVSHESRRVVAEVAAAIVARRSPRRPGVEPGCRRRALR
jgi:very-short-patch-repair endonuclease